MEAYFALTAFALALLARWYFARVRTSRRRLGSFPITPIGQVQGGVVRLVGRVQAIGDSIIAPGTGRGCVAYSVHVTERDGQGWRTTTRFHFCAPFWIEDATGRARVDAGRNVAVIVRRTEKAAANGTRLMALIRALGIDHLTFRGKDKDFRFAEAIVRDGDEVSVLGAAGVDLARDLSPPGPRQFATCVFIRDQGMDGPLLIGEPNER